jgi:predicted pyridoxine 5'-phosphate oxidase superfamily flavin-nucleotide-binding protein
VDILTADMRKVIADTELGFVATVCPDGSPNLSPKGTTAVWDDDHLVFCDIHSPRTVANLRVNNRIEVNVVDPIVRKGYRFKGTAIVLRSGDVFERAIATLYETTIWKPHERIRSIVMVHVEEARALVSPAYDKGRTEAEVIGQWMHHYEDMYGAAPLRPDSKPARDV